MSVCLGLQSQGVSPSLRLSFSEADGLLRLTSAKTPAKKVFIKQECIAVRCVPPARYRGGSLPDRDPPPDRPPWTETSPLDRDLPLWTETLP